jgi:hypothetical protein
VGFFCLSPKFATSSIEDLPDLAIYRIYRTCHWLLTGAFYTNLAIFRIIFKNVLNETPETTILQFLFKKVAKRTCCRAAFFSVEIKNKKCNAKKVIFWGW